MCCLVAGCSPPVRPRGTRVVSQSSSGWGGRACDQDPTRGRAKRAGSLGGSSRGGAAMTEPHKLTDLVPVEVLTEVNTAIAVLEIQGPAITEALRQLDRATTMAWRAMNMLGVTDDEWELVKREVGIERGWEAAYQLVSTLDLPSLPPSADETADRCRA